MPRLTGQHQSYNISHQGEESSSKTSIGSKITRGFDGVKKHFHHRVKPKELDSKAEARSLVELICELKQSDKMLQVEGIFRIPSLAAPSTNSQSVHEDERAITLSNAIKKKFKEEFFSSSENKEKLNTALRDFIDNKKLPSRGELPEPFVHMITLFQSVTKHKDSNLMSANNLAIVIAPNVLGDDVDPKTFLAELYENTTLIKECIERAQYN